MKTHTGSARQNKVRKNNLGAAHLDALLAHKSDNPFVKMVRAFFFYSEETGKGLRPARVPSGAHFHRKSLAH